MKKPIVPIPPIKKYDGSGTTDDKQKVNIFAEHLEATFSQTRLTVSQKYHSMKTLLRAMKQYLWTLLKKCKQKITTNINSKFAPSFDLITGEVLKNLKKGIILLTYLINASYRLKYVPDVWKVSEMIMIPKPATK